MSKLPMVVQAVRLLCFGHPSFIFTPRLFIVSGLNEGVVHGQPFPRKLENPEAGNTKTCWE
jgi:hypothetical protein